ncbi:unnamed protein product [Leptosia nina]|uniref:C2H2-type domain-containing protein n=1 Tax=Leptosia nina TaxID=320188 RepID=A0AAV1JFU3_9NEOP
MNPVVTNRAGRPNKNTITKFTEEPRSIISQLLSEERQQSLLGTESDNIILHEKFTTNKTVHKPPFEYVNLASPVLQADREDQQKPFELNDFILSGFNEHYNDLNLNKTVLNRPKKHKSEMRDVNRMPVCSYPQCTYTTKNSSNMSKHKRTHSDYKLYLCDQCTFSTKFSNSLNVHKRLHTNVKPFLCPHCDYRCNSSSNLKKHIGHRH